MNNEQNNNVSNEFGNVMPENNLQPDMQQVNTVQTVENQNSGVAVTPQPTKNNKNTKIILIVLGVLIVVALIIGILWFLKGNNIKNVYYQAIDNLASNAITNINKIDEELNKPIGLNANISLDVKTNDSSMKALTNLLNKMNINMNVEMDYNNKLSNMTYDIKYNNGSLIKADLILNNQNAYLDLNNLYNKTIKLPEDAGFDKLWQAYDIASYKTIVEEMATIIKSSLKEEYFTQKDANVNKVKTKVFILTLNSKDIYNLKIDILNNIINDEKLITALNNITGSSVKETLESIKNNVVESEDTFVSEVYVNKSTKKLEKVNIMINDSALELNKSDTDKFDIVLNNNDNKVVIGYVIMSDTNFTILLKDTGVDVSLEFKTENDTQITNINFEVFGTKIKLNLERKEDNGTTSLEFSDDNNNNLTLNIDYKITSINNVTSKNVSNYIELDKMTENDYNTIMQNLYQNSTLMSLMQSLATL